MAEFTEVMKAKRRMCFGILCDYCPISSNNNSAGIECGNFMMEHMEDAEEIIMKWAKEHPIKTNADKFKEVFGYNIDHSTGCHKLEDCDGDCIKCEFSNFWNQEYKEPKGE